VFEKLSIFQVFSSGLQEKDKQVPVLTSLNYARPCAKRVDPIDTRYFRRPVVQNFYARTGIDMSPDLERQCIKTS